MTTTTMLEELTDAMDRAELIAVYGQQHADMARYVGEFAALMDLRATLVGRVLNHPKPMGTPSGGAA